MDVSGLGRGAGSLLARLIVFYLPFTLHHTAKRVRPTSQARLGLGLGFSICSDYVGFSRDGHKPNEEESRGKENE